MTDPDFPPFDPSRAPDLADVRGQESAKRALEIAAAGGHSILLIGPSGSGKTLLVRCLPGLLPPTETGAEPPLREPEPRIPPSVLVGSREPGEVDLARGGVLFLDGLPGFGLRRLRALRRPLEDNGRRTPEAGTVPPPFLFAAAMRPCPCSQFGDPRRECVCPPWRLERYWSAVTEQVIDLVHLQVDLAPVDLSDFHRPGGESSHQVAQRVLAARTRQRQRSGSRLLNAHLPARALPEVCSPSDSAQRLLDHAFERLALTVRAMGTLLRVARTVADLAGSDGIRPPHVAEAIQLRSHAWFDEPSQQGME